MGFGRVWQGFREWWQPDRGVAGHGLEPCQRRVESRTGPDWSGRGQQGHRVIESSGATPAEHFARNLPRHGTDSDISDEELLEFLAGDHEPEIADPEFKERLRKQLWAMVQENHLTHQ